MKSVVSHLIFVFLVGIFFYYCGSTAVVEEPMGDTQSQDITLKDGVSDASNDTLQADISIKDGNIEDIPSLDTTFKDIVLSDEGETDVLEDVEADVFKDGGGDGGGRDTAFTDNEITDTSTAMYSISGKVTVNGGNPESGRQVYVMIFDKIPGEDVPPIAYTTTDSNNDYIVDGLSSGRYYVFAIYDINGDGNPDPSTGDPFGYYPDNPVEIKSSSLTGININIHTIQLMVSSVFMRRQQSQNAYLISLVAKVINPKDGSPLSDATVTATDPMGQTYTLTYNPQTGQYEKNFNPYAQNAVIALEGNYQFTIQHPFYGSQPVRLPLPHKPMKELVTITQPLNNSTINAGEDLTVAWKNPPGADINMMIQLIHRVNNQMREIMRDEKQPIPNPYTIDGGYLDESGMYIINVISGRYSIVPNGLSIEATSGTVIVNAQ